MSSRKIPTLQSVKVKVGITIGDPSGIGPEIALKAVAKLKGKVEFVIIGDKWVLDKVQGSCLSGRQAGFRVQSFKLVDLNNVPHKNFYFGKIKAEYGKASVEYLDKALELLKIKEIDCLVTCPVSKEAINLAGFKGFSGHTEYLTKHLGVGDYLMLLLNQKLKFSLVTRHIPLGAVPLELDQEKIRRNIILTYKSLKDLFAVRNPRIVVCGLNPHASDNGVIGDEENRIIKPALRRLRIKNIFGPYSSDAAIAAALRGKYDCVIAMYHDQALIPLKLSGNSQGVNMTLGLPFVRTSPLHGTAFDIAGKNIASPDSLVEAIKLATRCAFNLKKA
jgi:4-hydroxythreonine-4-phosphate dehydrogenase